MDALTLTQAIEGYLLAASARRLSWHTIRDYSTTFRKLLDFLGSDPLIDKLTPRDVEAFLASRDEVSKKTLLNYHTGLSALWTWCLEEHLVTEQILNRVRRPKPEKIDIIPYSQSEVKVLLDSLTHSRSYTRPGKRQCANTLWLTDRNRAIIYLLLDTGIRADELSTCISMIWICAIHV